MQKNTFRITILLALIGFSSDISAQCINGYLPTGKPCGGTIQSAVPFLMITPDARSGGMGDVGIALSPDANALHFNASKLAFAKEGFGTALNITPWLRDLGVNDIFMGYGSAFLKVGKEKNNAVGLAIRYFSLGTSTFTDINGNPLSEGKVFELETALSYSRKLNEHFAIGLTAKYIHSDLAPNQTSSPGNESIQAGKSVAFDVSLTYQKPFRFVGFASDLMVGLVVKNVGSKIMYFRNADYLPANLGIGAAWKNRFAQHHVFTLAADANKLLVPTPNPFSINQEWRNQSLIPSILNSFSDAPGGFSEELQEINASFGIEYVFYEILSLRGGYFYENALKGGRQYYTLGLGLNYKSVGVNFSYLLPSNVRRNPLDNTLRFSLMFKSMK